LILCWNSPRSTLAGSHSTPIAYASTRLSMAARRIIFADEYRLTLCEDAVSSRLFLCALFVCVCAVIAVPQNPIPRSTIPPPQSHDTNPPLSGEDDARARITHDMEKRAAKDRAAALKADTDKLLKLSVELKQYVDKSDENVLSLDVIKKAEEIERLAHSVKDKMKGPN
jgi:hypothetical protein